jgi:hypothetical protein
MLRVVKKVGITAGNNPIGWSASFPTIRWSDEYSILTIRHELLHGGLILAPLLPNASIWLGFHSITWARFEEAARLL